MSTEEFAGCSETTSELAHTEQTVRKAGERSGTMLKI